MPLIGKRSEVGLGKMIAVDLQGTRVGVANVDGKILAFTDTCPHADHSLSLGQLDGLLLTCNRDGSQFDLASGNVVHGPATKRIRTYHVSQAGDDLHV